MGALPAWLIRDLRSDHAGESGAVAIYRGIEALYELGEVGERPGQAIDLIDHDELDLVAVLLVELLETHGPGTERRSRVAPEDQRHRPHAARRVPPDLGGGELGVPKRHDAEWDQPPLRLAAPLLDHPVVVGLDA